MGSFSLVCFFTMYVGCVEFDKFQGMHYAVELGRLQFFRKFGYFSVGWDSRGRKIFLLMHIA